MMKWKDNLEAKGMKVNVGKTKWMVSGENAVGEERSGRWPCSVCRKGVGRNSLQCMECQKWVHAKCSGIKGKLHKVTGSFICRTCTNKVNTVTIGTGNMDLGDGILLEKVDNFCSWETHLANREERVRQ